MNDYGRLDDQILQVIDFGKTIKKKDGLPTLFTEYIERLTTIIEIIRKNFKDERLEAIVNTIKPEKILRMNFLERLLLLKFRADYLESWKTTGKYKFCIDEMNLKLNSIRQRIYSSTTEH